MNLNMILSMIAGAMISYVAIPPIVRVARQKSLLALPNGRTSHEGAIPALGGIAIFAGLVMGASLFVDEGFPKEFQYIIPAFLIIFFLGLKDDIVHISWNSRLIGQILAGLLIIVLADVRIGTFHGMFGVHELPLYASYGFSLFVFVGVLNAYNLIDGIDGLASGLGLLASLIFGIWLFKLGHKDYAVLAFALFGGLIPFYIFNVFGTTNKLFMGDTGSNLMGAVFAILAMKILCCEMPIGHPLNFDALPALVIAVMVIPITDTIRIFIFRLVKGKSPFAADKNHFHHYLLRLGFSHWQASTAIAAFNTLVIFAAFFMREMPARWVVILTIGPTLIIMLVVKQMAQRDIKIIHNKKVKKEESKKVSKPVKERAKQPELQVYPD